jgi:hypothetical protein
MIPYFNTTKNLTIRMVEREWPELFVELNKYPIDYSLSEKIWLYQNKLNARPNCLGCDKEVGFTKFYKGYNKFCSKNCAAAYSHKNEGIKEKRLVGFINSNKNNEIRKEMTIRANITKANKTELEKEKTLSRRRNNVMSKWGVDSVSRVESIVTKISNSNKKPKEKVNKKIEEKLKTLGYEVVSLTKGLYEIKCPKCNKIIEISRPLFNQRVKYGINSCISCNPINQSGFELNILDWIKTVYDGTIIHKWKNKFEIDIYLPDLKLGLECNGIWWHSEIYKEKNYHINKTNWFKKLDIDIIHIWEDLWKNKSDIIKSRILSKLGKTNKIGARLCKVVELDNKTYSSFMETNHLQASVGASVKLGLTYNNEIVSVMSFGKYRKNMGKTSLADEYELLRMANKLNYTVIGGAGKLLKYFIDKYKPIKIISYSLNDWGDGNLYTKLGFNFVKNTVVNYFWFDKTGNRYGRFNFRKDRLVAMGYDKNKTEIEIMHELGYFRTYDTGSKLFELNIINLK